MSTDNRRIGRVVSVTGPQVICLLDKMDKSDPRAEFPSIEVGAMVKIYVHQLTLVGLVRAVSIPMPSMDGNADELMMAELELLGEIAIGTEANANRYRRGVSFFPSLGSEIYLTTNEDIQAVYASPGAHTANIGHVHQQKALPAFVKIDDLLGKHFAVLGTTGCGKSCAVTVILKALLRENSNSRILLLDPHNEYASAFGDEAQRLDPVDSLEVPHWLFNFEELCAVVIKDDELRSAQTSLLAEAIIASKLKPLAGVMAFPITVDTPTPYSMADVIAYIQQAQGKLTRAEPVPVFARLVSRLKNLIGDSRYSFMFGHAAATADMRSVLSRLFRIPIDGKAITITDLSGIPSEILNVVVSVLCRMALDFALWSDRSFPMVIVCEEAHRYAPHDNSLGFEPTKRALTRIAKEGRKYGVSLCIVSQRPSDIARDILSECNTIFALRMNNQADQDLIRAMMTDSGQGLLEFLPSLRTGEAITIGEGVSVPLRLIFSTLPANEMPRGKTASFSSAWHGEPPDPKIVSQVIDRWRNLRKHNVLTRKIG
jgi:DNA helicase HerA-like ATPase